MSGITAEPHDAASAPGKVPRRYGGRTPEERQADRRRRLLDSGLELFGTAGFSPVGINRICASAGVTARHFYEDFATREDLFVALYDEIMAEVVIAIGEALDAAPSDHIGVTETSLSAYAHALLDDPRRARICCVELQGVSEQVRRHAADNFVFFADMIHEQAIRLAESGEIRIAEQTNFINTVLVGGTNEAMVAWLRAENPPPIDTLVEELTRVYVAVGLMPSTGEWRAARSNPSPPTAT